MSATDLSEPPVTPSLLLICPDFKPNLGGEAELAYRLSCALRQAGHDFEVLAPMRDRPAPEDAPLQGTLRRTLPLQRFRPLHRPTGWLAWPGAMRALDRALGEAIERVSPDFCLVTTYMTWVALGLWRHRLSYALFLHGEDVVWMAARGGISLRVFRRACDRATWIYTNSEPSRGKLLALSPHLADRSESVGCGVPTTTAWTADRRAEARQALGWPRGPMLLTVAKLIRRKGIDTVIRALPAIIERHPGCRFTVVGEGPDRAELERLARRSGVADRVLMMGRIDEEEKEKGVAASDIYVMVSYPGAEGEEDGFGISFLEANLHGLPVIGSRCGGIPESVEHERNGLLVDPRRPDQVAEAVDRLLREPRTRSQMVNSGRRRIEERFNWDAISRRITARLASRL